MTSTWAASDPGGARWEGRRGGSAAGRGPWASFWVSDRRAGPPPLRLSPGGLGSPGMLVKVGPNRKLLLSVWNILGKLGRRQGAATPLHQALLPTTSPQGTSGHRSESRPSTSKKILTPSITRWSGTEPTYLQGMPIPCGAPSQNVDSPGLCIFLPQLALLMKFQKTFSKLIMEKFVIGIGGVTNGGKTTLAKKLQKHLPNCSVISQDDFFKPRSEIETDKNGFLQYDVLEALNMEKMMSTVSCWMKSPRHSPVSTDWRNAEEVPILIIEGFLLFNYKPLETIWNRRYFVTIPYEECKRRRSTRVYEPPDPEGYFDGHVWPMYLKHRGEIESIEEIVYLDGTKSEEELFSQVYEDLRQELAKQKCKYCPTEVDGEGTARNIVHYIPKNGIPEY